MRDDYRQDVNPAISDSMVKLNGTGNIFVAIPQQFCPLALTDSYKERRCNFHGQEHIRVTWAKIGTDHNIFR